MEAVKKPKDATDFVAAGGVLEAKGAPVEPPPEPLAAHSATRPPVVLRRVADVLPAALEMAARRQAGTEKPVVTPWKDLNEQLGGGLWPGLHMFVGGTAAGKSTLALQVALNAARESCAVAYVGLELDENQVALRLAGAQTGVAWSDLYVGRASNDQIEKVRAGAKLPDALYLTSARAGEWSASNLRELAAAMRQQHPDTSRPIVIIVDYLQVVGADETPGRPPELREKIGRTSYAARAAAVDHSAAVVLVSSVAREHYEKVGGKTPLSDAGLERDAGTLARRIKHPDAIVGLGKESGEIEYAADTVTVVARWPDARAQMSGKPSGLVVLASAKVRVGLPSWCVLRSNGTHLFDANNGDAVMVAGGTNPAAGPKGGRPSTQQQDATVAEDDEW